MANQAEDLNAFEYPPLNVMPSDYDMSAQQSLTDPTFNEFMDPNFWNDIGDGTMNSDGDHGFDGFGLEQLANSPDQKFANAIQRSGVHPPPMYSADLTSPLSATGERDQRFSPKTSPSFASRSSDIKRDSISKKASSVEDAGEKDKDSLSVSAEEDKRRRNTAASARFRVKKKQREQAMEKTAKEMTEKCNSLETRVKELEKENRLLKGLLTEKAGKGKANSEIGSSDEDSPRAPKRSKHADGGR